MINFRGYLSLIVVLSIVFTIFPFYPVPDVFSSTGRWEPRSEGLFGGYIYSLAINPISANTVYAGTDGGGVFKSTNGGGSWSAVNTGITNHYIYSLAIDPP